MAELHTHRGSVMVFLWKHSSFRLRSAWKEISSGLYYLPNVHANPCMTPPSRMPPTIFTWHFRRGTTFVVFTLGNRCTSFMPSSQFMWHFHWGTICVPFSLEEMYTSQCACHLHNFCDMSKDLPARIRFIFRMLVFFSEWLYNTNWQLVYLVQFLYGLLRSFVGEV